MLLLTHAPFLSVHLFKALVFCELSHQLLLELVFQALFFGSALGLQPKLEVLCELELLSNSTLAFGLGLLLGNRCLFLLLNVKIVTEFLLELLLGTDSGLLGGQLLKEGLPLLFSFLLQRLNLLSTILLLGCVSTDHLIFIIFELFLPLLKRAFLVVRQDHISLRLLLLLLHDLCQLSVFINHFLYNGVHLFLLLQVLCVSLSAYFFLRFDLALNELLVFYKFARLFGDGGTILRVLLFLNLQVGCIDGCVLLEALLLAILSFCRLGGAFLVEIRVADVGLKLFEFVALAAHFLDFALAALILNLKFRHFTSQLLFHLSQIDALSALQACVRLANSWVERGLPKLS